MRVEAATRAQLEASCSGLIGREDFTPPFFIEFLNNMAALIGTRRNKTTNPLVSDQLVIVLKEGKIPSVLLSPEGWQEILLAGKPVMREMVSFVDFPDGKNRQTGRAILPTVTRRFYNLGQEEVSFVSGLNEATVKASGKNSDVASVSNQEAKVLSVRIFSAWQKSQDVIK